MVRLILISTHIELHPGEELATEHNLDGLADGDNEGAEVDEGDDTTLLALLSALLVAETLDGVSTDETAVRVDDQDDLLLLVGEPLKDGSDGGSVVVQALGGGLSADGGVLDGDGLVALGVEDLLDGRVADLLVPRTRRENEGRLGSRHDVCVVGEGRDVVKTD